jgi:molybdate transport system regulatory protein
LSQQHNIDFRFWVTSGDEAFLGKGRVILLLKIHELGSLRKAASALKMSYRKAYYAIDHVNKVCDKPVVILKRGGASGGSSEITPFGQELITRFQKIQEEIDGFMKNLKF